jgi:hypothetical protein
MASKRPGEFVRKYDGSVSFAHQVSIKVLDVIIFGLHKSGGSALVELYYGSCMHDAKNVFSMALRYRDYLPRPPMAKLRLKPFLS